MFHIALLEPEIPPNTGNIIRLCANTGSLLHLIHPLGFDLNDKRLRRAGLDYRDMAAVQDYASWEAFRKLHRPTRLYAFSTKGTRLYSEPDYLPGDTFLFGPETRGLSADILGSITSEKVLRIPMLPANRSLNLSNAVAVVVYEAWRQQRYAGSQDELVSPDR